MPFRSSTLRLRLAPFAVVAALAVALPGLAAAACPDDAAVASFAAAYLAKQPVEAFGTGLDAADAACARNKLVADLEKTLGPVVGYKAGLTNKAVQERFGATAPVLGVLLQDMILGADAEISAKFGIKPVYEADMVLVVADEGINAAGTPEEAIQHISGVRPFIELADLMLADPKQLTASVLAASNVGARLGVLGEMAPIDTSPAGAAALANAEIVLTNGDGTVLSTAPGSAVLGNPLNAVIWVAQELAAEGKALKAGDLVSVGSFSALTPPKPGEIVTVTYKGLQGEPSVSVEFNDE
jgi:2-keto-4-pentenoate hydratase